MGKYWLHDFPHEAAKRGLTIHVYPGWELRSRSTGGFDGIWGICMHHTASQTVPANDMYFQWAASGYSQPIGNFSLHRDGTIVLGAAGAANTQGKGGPYPTSKGMVPLDAGNRFMIAIEACNNGIGEPWPEAQIQAYEALVEVLCDVYDLDPTTDVLLHATWAPSRKIDPAGPTPSLPEWGGVSGARTWDLTEVRKSVLNSGGVPDMSDFQITNPVRIVDSRRGTVHNTFKSPTIPAGMIMTFRPHNFTDANATGVILTVTGLSFEDGGHFTFWSGDGGVPVASHANPSVGSVANNMVWVPLKANRTFSVFAGGNINTKLGLIIDQVGWYTTA